MNEAACKAANFVFQKKKKHKKKRRNENTLRGWIIRRGGDVMERESFITELKVFKKILLIAHLNEAILESVSPFG